MANPLKGLQPIGLIVVVPNVLVVADSVPAKDVKELVALMKAKPKEFQYASSGVGSTQHIAGEAFVMLTGTQAVHIPYKGSAQAHGDLITGRVQIMLDTTSSAMPLWTSRVTSHIPLSAVAAAITPEGRSR